MAINESLIKGAGKAAPKFQKVELFSKSAQQAMNLAIAKRKAERNARDQQISAIVSDLENVDISVTPSEQIEQQYEISGNIRNEVAALAAQRAKLPQNSPEAFAIDQQINRKKQMFSQVVANAKDFKELHEEYTKDGGWNMSKGVDPEKQKQLDEIFINKNYTIEYDENGATTYKTQYGQINQKDLSNYFLKDDEMALTVTNYADDVLQNGEKGVKLEGARKDILYRKILNDINTGGPSRLKSLIYDDLVEGQSLGLAEDATAEDAAEAIVRNLMNVNNQGLVTYQDKQNKLNNDKEQKDNRTPGEINRSDKAQADIKYVREQFNNIPAPDPSLLSKPRKTRDSRGVEVASNQEEVNMKIFLDHTMNETNKIIGTKGTIQFVDGKYKLQEKSPSVTGQVLNEVDITDQMKSYIQGNKEPLLQAIERNIFKVQSVDYPQMSQEKLESINPN
jgi:hypothetical protein